MLTPQDLNRIQQETRETPTEIALDNFISDTHPWKILLLDIFDIISFLIFVAGIVLFTRFFIFNPYTVVWASMEPNFHENDFIVVDKFTTRFSEFKRWDVIVFVPQGKDIPYIKRIVWLAGETVIVQNNGFTICSGEVTIPNDTCTKLTELYIPSDFVTEAKCWKDTFYVSTGYFAVGDHRGHSTDSLCCFGFGCYVGSNYTVTDGDIIGKVLVRLFPNFTYQF
jgi:signal peptidase I